MNFQSNPYELSIESDQNMEMPDVLKKGVWKFNIVHWLQLNNYSKYFMCASTALQTSLNHTFSE